MNVRRTLVKGWVNTENQPTNRLHHRASNHTNSRNPAVGRKAESPHLPVARSAPFRHRSRRAASIDRIRPCRAQDCPSCNSGFGSCSSSHTQYSVRGNGFGRLLRMSALLVPKSDGTAPKPRSPYVGGPSPPFPTSIRNRRYSGGSSTPYRPSNDEIVFSSKQGLMRNPRLAMPSFTR